MQDVADAAPLDWPDDRPVEYLVTVDTEEEFDWNAPFQRSGHTTFSTPKLRRFQQFVAKYGVKPVYFIDYSIVTDDEAVGFLREAVAADTATVGVHLHPWVTPPFEEEVNGPNSFAGNLPPELESAKLDRMIEAIRDRLGIMPQIYRAGRYGIGPASFRLLAEKGFRADSSIRPRFDYSGEDGPDFSGFDSRPFWIDRDKGLVELPLTTVYNGLLRTVAPHFATLFNRSRFLQAGLAKTGLVERVPLTPEGIGAREAMEAIDVALDDGLRLLCFSFHSPSLATGHTPYVTSSDDLDGFYDWWRTVIAHLDRRGVAPARIETLLDRLSAKSA